MNTYSESISGPRWVDIEGFLFAYAQGTDIKVTIDHVSKNIFRKRVWFSVTGPEKQISKWCDDLIGQFS